MNGAAAVAPGWSRRKWGTVLLLIFGLQLGLIFWLGERGGRPRPPAQIGFSYQMPESPNGEWLSLLDPTLFALPHREGFSGLAWLEAPTLPAPLYDWPAPTNWLAWAAPPSGGVLGRFLIEHPAPFVPPSADTAPELVLPRLLSVADFPTGSVLVVVGDLADRQFLNRPALPSWANSDLLDETRVQVVVNARGQAISTALLSSSGHAGADQFALDQARAAQFAAAPPGAASPSNPLSGLTWGQFLFQWHTVAAATTNAAAAH
jgi:TonB family protein